MALGMEVGLATVHILLDGDTAPLPKKGAEPPIFGPSLLVDKSNDFRLVKCESDSLLVRIHCESDNLIAL